MLLLASSEAVSKDIGLIVTFIGIGMIVNIDHRADRDPSARRAPAEPTAHCRARTEPTGRPRAMLAVQISELSGPDAVSVVDCPSPSPATCSPQAKGVIDVAAAGVSFPGGAADTRALSAQTRPALHSRGGGRRAPSSPRPPQRSERGDRVMAFTALGGMAERAVAPAYMTFPARLARLRPRGLGHPQLPHRLLRVEAARALAGAGESVLVHGAAGGVRHRCAAGRQGARRPRSRSSPQRRRSASPARPGPIRSCARTGPGASRP